MDGLKQPVGDLPPQIYWRRRLVIFAGIALFILVLWFLITSPAGGGEGRSADPGASPTPTSQATVAPDGTETRSCIPGDVVLTMTANPFAVAPDALPRFDVAIEHVGDSACLLDTEADGTELHIRSGSDRIWNSTDCPVDSPINAAQFLLQDNASEDFSISWPRQRSDVNCTTQLAEPAAGFYLATLTIQGISSEETQFQLTE